MATSVTSTNLRMRQQHVFIEIRDEHDGVVIEIRESCAVIGCTSSIVCRRRSMRAESFSMP